MTSFSVSSCANNIRLIGKTQTEYGRIKFYSVNGSGDSISVGKIYADVDSINIKRYNSFYPDRIVMTGERAKGLTYTVLFQQLPGNYDSNFYHQLSPFDTLVLSQATIFLNTTKYSYWQ